MNEKENVLCEIKTLLRILNTHGNVFVPKLNGADVSAVERLDYFVRKAINDFGMSIDEIEELIK